MYFPHKRIILVIFSLALVLAFSTDLWAVALSPEVVEKLRQEGRLEEAVRIWESAAERGMYEITPDTPVRSKNTKFGDVDTLKPLVVCVDFIDNVSTYDTSDFSELLFSKDFTHPTGSFRDYYWENSYGQHDPNGGVYGWVRAPQTYAYYTWGAYGLGPYPHNCQKLVQDILAAIDPYVNFANYDYNGDGWIDGLIFVHAGPGAEQTGSVDDIWSHRWSIPTEVRDGVSMSSYTMQPEMRAGGSLITIGVFCHEWGHFLGIHWEEYDSDYSSEGLGRWTVMAGGSYNHDGKTPAHHSAYCKYYLGWAQVNRLFSNQTNVEILQAETSPISYRLWQEGMGGSQYFMVENRQKTRFDSYLPGSGLLIYHVDTNKPGNDLEWCPGSPATHHFKTAIEQADGKFQLEGCGGFGMNDGDWSDPFPGYSDKRAFDDTTTPSSRDYYDNSTQVAVWDISDSDSAMYANLDVEWSQPALFLDEFILDDIIGGDGDGRPEGGETVKIYFTISNIWLPINGTTLTGSADTAGITFTDDYSYLGTIGTGGSANNYSDPMEFVVDMDFPGRPTIFTLHVEGNGGSYTHDFDVEVWAGNAEILIVDDAGDYQDYYSDALDSLKQIYDIWDAYSKGDPDFSFNIYNYLIWYTGDHKTNLFTKAQVESLMTFLDNGGRLFLTSQDAVEVLASSSDPWDTLFLNNYLHVGYGGQFSQYLIGEQAGDEIGDSMFIYPLGTPGANNQTSKDILVPDSAADPVLIHSQSWWVPATDSFAATKFQKFENDTLYFRVVVFGFGFEAINQQKDEQQGKILSKPPVVMQKVLDWFKAPGPTINVISPNGGEDWFVDSTYYILWESISFKDSVKIEIRCTNNGVTTCSTIVDTTTNDGTYCWTVPDTPSDSCLIIVSDVENANPSDTSDDYFRIINYINVMSPNGEEPWFVDSTYNVLWQSISSKDSVKIEYCYTDGGLTTCSNIVDTTTNDGVYPWIIPDTPSDSCLIIVSDVGDGIPLDTSDGLFCIIDYLPGDFNIPGGDEVVDLGDVVFLINYLYKDGNPPDPMAAADVTADCVVDLGDVVYLINYLYKGGDPPKPTCCPQGY